MPRHMTFADWLVREMGRRDLSRAALARASGVRLARIQGYLAGTYQPSLDNARRLCDGLGADIRAMHRAVRFVEPPEPPRRAVASESKPGRPRKEK